MNLWRRYWFTPTPVVNLAVSRLVLVAIVLWMGPMARPERVALAPDAMWKPVATVKSLGLEKPSLETARTVGTATLVACAAAAMGLFTHTAFAVLAVLFFVQEAWAISLGKVSHAVFPLMYALVFFAIAPAGNVLSVDAWWRRWRGDPPVRLSEYARWPIDLVYLQLSAFYLSAGLSKLRYAGLAWADGYTLQFHLLGGGRPLAEWMASSIWLCTAASVAVLFWELTFFLGIYRPLRPFYLVGGFAFHVGTNVLMGIGFIPTMAIYAIFVPWSRMADWITQLFVPSSTTTGSPGPPAAEPGDLPPT